MCEFDESLSDLFINLQKLSTEYPDKIDVYVDDDEEVEFEVEFDFFFENLTKIFGF